MIWASAGCLIACLGLAVAGPRWSRSIHPAIATRLLTAISVAVVLGVLWVLGLAAGIAIGQIPAVARFGDWSPARLAAADPMPRWIAYCCLAVTLWAVALGLRTIAGQLGGLLRLQRTLADVPAAGQLTVLPDLRPIAFATPAAGGRIVVSTGLLRLLGPDERRVLLTHEAAHIRHRHYWWGAVAHVAARMCPLLDRMDRAVTDAVERWADEETASRLGDRSVVARALSRAALYNPTTAPVGGVAAVGGQVVARVEAMMSPAPRWRVAPVWILIALLLFGVSSAWAVGATVDTLFDQAEAVQPWH